MLLIPVFQQNQAMKIHTRFLLLIIIKKIFYVNDKSALDASNFTRLVWYKYFENNDPYNVYADNVRVLAVL